MKSIVKISELSRDIELPNSRIAEMERAAARYPFRISEYPASLMDPRDPNCPIRLQFLPDIRELSDDLGQADPLLESEHTVTMRLIQVYPDRVAVVVCGNCASLCRFCFRKSLFKKSKNSLVVSEAERGEALEYIAANTEIKDVLVTGGDPLLLPEDALDSFLKRLRTIRHVEIIRVGTRVLTSFPERITPSLASMLARHHPLWLNLHFNHPRELTTQAAAAADLLLSKGIPLGNQSVLLKGVNDNSGTMKALSRGLLKMRIRPYYLFQCHLVAGTAYLRTTVETGQSIISELRGRLTGLGIPLYTIDTPYGKVPMNPNYSLGRQGDSFHMRTYRGHLWREPNPPP